MSQFVTTVIIILPILVIGLIIYRYNKKQINKVLSGQKTLEDANVWMRDAIPFTAQVISKSETIHPDAKGIAKVDLELKIQLPYGSPVETKTCWLVEIPSLSQLEPGASVPVKFDPKRPQRVYPVVPWARIWLFGK
jgi:hypothetical protein